MKFFDMHPDFPINGPFRWLVNDHSVSQYECERIYVVLSENGIMLKNTYKNACFLCDEEFLDEGILKYVYSRAR